MIDLIPLLTFLRIVSIVGLIAMVVTMIAVIYSKLEEQYPDKVKKYKWVFPLIAILMSGLFVFLFQLFFL